MSGKGHWGQLTTDCIRLAPFLFGISASRPGRNSISHQVDESEPAVYIGTNLDYMIYQKLGTGKYTEGGRPTPWVYQDDNGNWHWTAGNPAQPFLAPAVKDHQTTYRNIIEDELKNG